MRTRSAHRFALTTTIAICAIVVVGFALRLAYQSATPLWQGPDEPQRQQHVATIQRIWPQLLSEQRYLLYADADLAWQAEVLQHMRDHNFNRYLTPRFGAGVVTFEQWTGGEGLQLEDSFPLYFILAAIPGALAGNLESLDAQLRVGRFFSLVLSTLHIPVAYVAGRLLGRPIVGLVAAAFVAMLPMEVWLAGVVSNDNLAVLASSLAFAAAIALIGRGPSWRWALLFVVSLAIGVASKRVFAPTLALIPVTILAVWWLYLPRLRILATAAWVLFALALLLAPIALVAIVREPRLVPMPIAAALFNHPDQPAALTVINPTQLLTSLWGRNMIVSAFQGFVGVFGWYSIRLPAEFYLGALATLQIAFLGVVLALARRARPRHWFLLVACAFTALSIATAAVGLEASTFFGRSVPQGRYFLALILPLGVMIAYGWLELVRPRWQPWLAAALIGVFAVASIVALTGTLQPAFQLS